MHALEQFCSKKALASARGIYDQHRILGSVEKDIEASDSFKAAGAEIRSTEEAVRRGVITVAPPWSKRIGLSVLGLRCARLPALSSTIFSSLAGNWVLVLMYRRCCTSAVNGLFGLASEAERSQQNQLHPLPRRVAEELIVLAAMTPFWSRT